MTRQVKNKTGWTERGSNKVADKTGLLRNMGKILGINHHHLNEATPYMEYGRIETPKARHGLASVKEPETLLRRGRMLR